MVDCDMCNWEIRYSKHIGDLSIFSKEIYGANEKNLQLKQVRNGIYITINRSSGKIMMIEIQDADKKIIGIDKMHKSSIINKIKECIA